MTTSQHPLHQLTANAIRALTMDAVQKANNGHPGMPMGMADVGVVLWRDFLKHNPTDPTWFDRDRFVLSAGHGSMLLYSLLHLTGYQSVSLDDIKAFRSWHSQTPGHPENFLTAGVETTTGPLGQGIANAVGMAMAERWLAAQYNRPHYPIVDHYTYCIASDGDLMEGISHEIGSLAGHLGLGKLIVLYDDNKITIDGHTSLAWCDDVPARFRAYGWHTLTVDGHDPDAVRTAIEQAQQVTDKPSLISCQTHIGYGSPHKQDTSSSHGSPLGVEEVKLTKENLGWEAPHDFYVPADVYDYMRSSTGAQMQSTWQTLFDNYQTEYPDLAATFVQSMKGELPANWADDIPTFEAGISVATRVASGKVLNAIAPHYPALLGGSADLSGSNKTELTGASYLTRDDFSGRYIHYGIREHGAGGIMNGMALHDGIRPYGGTFFVFSDYMRPSIRLAALMGLPIIYIFTHDSIGLGMDGPTHQPIEHLMSLRVMPNLTLFRPADANETAVGWQVAIQNMSGPTALILTRQGVPTLDRTQLAPADHAQYGAYVLRDMDAPQAIIIGTGSEVQIALEAQAQLAQAGVPTRVVSMPSWALFEQQSDDYQQSVFPDHITARVAVEAGATLPWVKYVGRQGAVVGLDRFGASAPATVLFEKLGVHAGNVVVAVQSSLTKNAA